MAEEIDSIGAEAAAITKTMLQLATLIALRTRERGQKEAEQRVKLTQVRVKEAKELAVRQVREAKARDPRNLELQQLIKQSGVQLTKDRQELAVEGREQQRERADLARVTSLEREKEQAPQRPAGMSYDSAERREALALHLAELGLEPELIEIRMMADMAQAHPPIELARTPIEKKTEKTRGLERDPRVRQRVRERER